MTGPDVLVVGAGPAGLTLALLLAEHGVAVEVVDPKDGPVPETRASVVHPRTLEVLAPLGLTPRMVADGRRVDAYEFRTDGRYVGRILYSRRGAGRTPYPFDLTYTQDQLERLLVQQLADRGVAVGWGWRGTAVQQDGDGVTATVAHHDGRERPVRARWLVAADGARSTVRELCAIPFHGRVDAKTYLVADTELVTDAGRTPLPRHRGIFDFLGDGSVSVYPRAEAGTYRVTAVLNDAALPAGLTDEETVREVVEQRSGLGVTAGTISWVGSTVVQHRIADAFHRGRVLLIGDAARAHSPFGGQGMNNGVQDAVNLAWKLALTVRGAAGDHLPRTLTEERRPPSLRIVRTVDRMSGAEVTPLRSWLVPRMNVVLLGLPAVSGAFFSIASQLWVHYRGSSLVGGTGVRWRGAGRVRPGDRMPPVALADGRTAHDLLHPLHHTLLLVPGARRGVTEDAAAAARELERTSALPLRVAAVTPRHRPSRPLALLLRPDGHIGWIGDAERLDLLAEHVRTRVLRPSPRPAPAAG